MNFYSILFIHLKVLSKSKLHILNNLIKKTKSFNYSNFIKVMEVNKNEIIQIYFINKNKVLD